MLDPFFEFFDSDRPEIDPESPEWKEISFKEYSRSPKILLPKLSLPKINLAEAILKRRTERDFLKKPIDAKMLGALLFWSAGLIHQSNKKPEEKFRRPHPSGGARYPIEIYAVVFDGQDIENGAYHYNLEKHALEKLFWASTENIKKSLPYDFSKKAAALVLLSFIGERVFKKYGSLGYKLGMIEAGHIGQNICLVGAALGLGVLSLGGMDYEVIQKELDLGEEESLFYQLAVGWPKKS